MPLISRGYPGRRPCLLLDDGPAVQRRRDQPVRDVVGASRTCSRMRAGCRSGDCRHLRRGRLSVRSVSADWERRVEGSPLARNHRKNAGVRLMYSDAFASPVTRVLHECASSGADRSAKPPGRTGLKHNLASKGAPVLGAGRRICRTSHLGIRVPGSHRSVGHRPVIEMRSGACRYARLDGTAIRALLTS